MDKTEAAERAISVEEPPAGSGVGTGFMVGLFGYLVAIVAFGYVGLFTGSADPGDQLAAGMLAAYLVALVATVAVVVAILRLRRQHQERMAVGLLGGMSLGLLLLVMVSLRIVGVMNEVPSTCPCEPIIDQVRFLWHD